MEGKQIKLLVVDDDSHNLEVVLDCFTNDPVQVLYAPNGKLGYELSVKEQPDLIIMDWAMPILNGIDCTLKLKANEHTWDIPVIIATGVMTETENLMKALESDALDYIRKPINKGELRARVKSALQTASHIHEIKTKNEEIQRLLDKEKALLNEQLDFKERELSKQAILRKEHFNLLQTIRDDLNWLADKFHMKKSRTYVELRDKISKTLEMDEDHSFLIHFEKVHTSFFHGLKKYSTDLTPNEVKLCAYIKLGMKNKEMADLMSIELGTVKSNLNRLKKKIGLAPEESLRKLLLAI